MLFLMIVLFSQAMLISMEKAFVYYVQRAKQNNIIHGIEGINSASNVIIDGLSEKSHEFAAKEYDSLCSLKEQKGNADMSEDELRRMFDLGFAQQFRDFFSDEEAIIDALCAMLTAGGIEDVSVDDDGMTKLKVSVGDDGCLYRISLDGVTLRYDNAGAGERRETFDYEIRLPEVSFYTENEELFNYCMVAGKGIYITGDTSSVIGNIYGGGHDKQQCRQAEASYGESGYYGGINILSTQLGVEADSIVSGGDININGSFVIFNPAKEQLECYGHRINKIEGFKNESVYSLDGVFYSIDMTKESVLESFYEKTQLVQTAMNRLELISGYYNSENDMNYSDSVHKIISDSDVDIQEDFRGIVMTPGNIIIRSGVNFEGLCLCGDRIYCMGNNNIVANNRVLREIIESEEKDAYTAEAKDYIGGITTPGFEFREYMVVPYGQ